MWNGINLEWLEKWNNSLTIHFELETADSFFVSWQIFIARKWTIVIEVEITLQAFFYKHHFYKQRQAEIGTNLSKS